MKFYNKNMYKLIIIFLLTTNLVFGNLINSSYSSNKSLGAVKSHLVKKRRNSINKDEYSFNSI